MPKFSKCSILRTRQNDLLQQCSVVVDVGAIYDEKTMRFDHHQKEFSTKFDSDRSTNLSSAGLVYKHFGRTILREFVKDWQVKVDE